MEDMPTVDFFGKKVSRLVCGGNPMGGFSHVSAEMDWDMICYYTMPKIMKLLDDCWAQGINTFQSRGDRHQMRAYLEHRLAGGRMQWIAQTASEFLSIKSNIAELLRYEPIALYNHGTHTDNCWYAGKMEEVHDLVKAMRDTGLPAGIGTHIPAVVEHIEEQGWETDFYMCCFYDLARGYKAAPAMEQDAYAKDRYPASDPARMAAVMRAVDKPCLAFKILAASRNCATPEATRSAFQVAFDTIKPTDMVVVGMFQKYSDQVTENAGYVRDILGA